MSQQLLPDSLPTALGGRCMDGSMAGYYWKEGTNKDLWVIYMKGGGACYDQASCTSRAKTDLGSSTKWAKTMHGSGFQSADCATNPDFCQANQVFVPYCTGDCHKGNNTSPSPLSWGFYFDGHANFAAIVNELVASRGLGKAGQKVLLTGGSAGGVGTFFNLDWLQARLPGTTVKGAPNAGWFFPAALPEDLPGGIYAPSDWAHFSAGTHGNQQTNATFAQFVAGTLWNTRGIVSPACVAAQQSPELWTACTSVGTAYKYIKAPLFVIENQFDTNQIYTQEKAPHQGKDAAEQALLEKYIAMYGEAMRNSTQQVLDDAPVAQKAQKDGLFLPSCLQHGVSAKLQGMEHILIANDWFFEKGNLSQHYRIMERCPAGSPTAGGAELPCSSSDTKCTQQLRKDGCLQQAANLDGLLNGLNACEKCASQHRADLTSQCASRAQVQRLCSADVDAKLGQIL
eukprot:g7128.t1